MEKETKEKIIIDIVVFVGFLSSMIACCYCTFMFVFSGGSDDVGVLCGSFCLLSIFCFFVLIHRKY